MIRHVKLFLLVCGIAFGLAALPVLGQNADFYEPNVNKKPLADYAKIVSAQNLDLTQPFRVELDGAIKKDGQLDKNQTRFIRGEGDEKIIELVKQGIMAFDDSGWFIYFSNAGFEKINLIVSQDSRDFFVTLKSEQSTPERARKISTGLNTALKMVLRWNEQNIKKRSNEEIKLLNALNVTVQEKNVIINFSMPKDVLHEIIQHELNKSKSNNANG